MMAPADFAIYAGACDPPSGPLDADGMIARARAVTGLEDLGTGTAEVERFRADFAILCKSINEEANLSSAGYRRAYSRLHVMLITRLRSIARRRAWPGQAADRIVAPLIGTGLPRSGTTFLHGLLACDPAHRAVRAWEAALAPPPIGAARASAAAFYQQILAFQGFTDPGLRAIHPFDASLPEECVFLQESNCSVLYTEFFNVPAFAEAVADKRGDDLRWQIGQMAMLQVASPDKRWVLKAPGHLFGLEELFLAFPDALVYLNHRDPARVIPSVAGLTAAIRGLFAEIPPDPAAIARTRLEDWSRALDSAAIWRDRHPDVQIVDVQFQDLIRDPMQTVAMVYDAFGLELSAQARMEMLRYIEQDQHGKAPLRRYTLAEYGLDEATVEAAFGDHLRRYNVPRERV